MQDAPNFQPRIQSLKKPEHQNLIKLAEDYHNAVCEGEKCIIYEKSAPLLKILPELVAGVIKYSNVEDLNDKFYMHAGIIGHIWMTRTSEKMNFRTGVLFSQLDYNGEKKNYFIKKTTANTVHIAGRSSEVRQLQILVSQFPVL